MLVTDGSGSCKMILIHADPDPQDPDPHHCMSSVTELLFIY
jgi:hypothetical protein